MLFNKSAKYFTIHLTFLLTVISTAFASDPTSWVDMQGVVESEHYQIKFPTSPNLTYKDEQMILTANDSQDASYLLKVFNPPKPISDACKAFAIFRLVISQPPKAILDYKISERDGYPVMDVATVNQQTGVKTLYHYVITSKNVWQIKCAYSDDSLHHHEEFLSSFHLTDK